MHNVYRWKLESRKLWWYRKSQRIFSKKAFEIVISTMHGWENTPRYNRCWRRLKWVHQGRSSYQSTSPNHQLHDEPIWHWYEHNHKDAYLLRREKHQTIRRVLWSKWQPNKVKDWRRSVRSISSVTHQPQAVDFHGHRQFSSVHGGQS